MLRLQTIGSIHSLFQRTRGKQTKKGGVLRDIIRPPTKTKTCNTQKRY